MSTDPANATPSDDKAQRLILRGSGSAAAGLVVRVGARILFLIIAARLFGAALFGAYTLAIAVVELWVTVGGLGMKRILFKLLDENESGRPPAHIVLDAASVVGAVSLGLAAVTMAVVVMPPFDRLSGETGAALLIVAPMIAGQALLDLFLAATRWQHRMRYEVVSRSFVEPYAAMAIAAAAWLAGFEETGLLISYWVGTLLALAYAIWGTRLSFGTLAFRTWRLEPGRMKSILREGAVPMANDLVSGLFTRLDLYLVGLFLGESPAGIYGVARQVRTPIRQVRQSFDGLLTPIVARTLAASGPQETGIALASAARLILAIQLFILVGLAVIGLPLLNWLGPEFALGYTAMLLLAAAETIQGAFGVSDLIFLYRQPMAALRITLATILVNLAAGALLIGPLRIDGAALSTLAAIAAGAIMRRHLLRSRFGLRIPLHYSAGPVIAAALALAAAAATGYFLPSVPAPVVPAAALVAALLAYAAALKLWLILAGESLALVKFQID